MKCKNCNVNDVIQYSKFSKGEFCCKKCSRSYSTKMKRVEINKKIGESLKAVYSVTVHHRKGKKSSTDTILKQQKSMSLSWSKRFEKMRSELKFDEYTLKMKRLYIIEKYHNVCQSCGFSNCDINGHGPYEIHHIDGNHNNWKEDNLTILCSNCHWFTPNYRFRGKKHTVKTKQIGRAHV